jgi:hypothetical protein
MIKRFNTSKIDFGTAKRYTTFGAVKLQFFELVGGEKVATDVSGWNFVCAFRKGSITGKKVVEIPIAVDPEDNTAALIPGFVLDWEPDTWFGDIRVSFADGVETITEYPVSMSIKVDFAATPKPVNEEEGE